jgi:hypothetical protein
MLGLLLLSLSGCGGGGGSVSSYQPTGASAKSALTTALEAWKSGREKPGTIDSNKPAVQVQDQIWDSGRKLKEFQIGDEKTSADGPTRFKVKLTFDGGDPASEEVEYVVFGKDPLWVCRDKDYQKMTGQ